MQINRTHRSHKREIKDVEPVLVVESAPIRVTDEGRFWPHARIVM